MRSLQKISFFLVLVLAANLLSAQSPRLLIDYVPGIGSHTDGELSVFRGTLTYPGFDAAGERGIYQYDPATDKISLLRTESSLDGEITGIGSNGVEALIPTAENGSWTRVYLSDNKDLSDLELLYHSDDAVIRSLRIQDRYSIVQQETLDGQGSELQQFLMIDGDRVVTYESDQLPGSRFDYRFFSIGRYFLIVDQTMTSLDAAVTVLDTTTDREVLLSSIIPGSIECDDLTQFSSYGRQYLLIGCGDEKRLFDLIRQVEVILPDDFNILSNISDRYLLYSDLQGNQQLVDLVTGESAIVFEGSFASRFSTRDYSIVSQQLDQSTIEYVYVDLRDGSVFNSIAQTTLNSDELQINNSAFAESGLHLLISDRLSDESVIVRGEEGNSPEVAQFTRPTSFYRDLVYINDNIYYINDNDQLGAEIFVLEYINSSSTNNEQQNQFAVMPNPVAGHRLTISGMETDGIVAVITSLSGQVLLEQSLDDNQSTLDLSNLAAGAYLVTVRTLEGKWMGTEKVIRL